MNFKTILVGALVSTMIAGCATPDDLKKATAKNKQELQREISNLKSSLNSKLSSEVKSLKTANKALDKKVVILNKNQQSIAKSLKTLKANAISLEATLASEKATNVEVNKKITQQLNILKSLIGEQGGDLDKSLDSFLTQMNKIEKSQAEKIAAIRAAFFGMVTDLKNNIKTLEDKTTTHKEKLSELDIQSNANTTSITDIKKLTTASHETGVEMVKNQINTLETQLKTLNKFGAFLKENSMEEIDDSPDTNNENSIEEETSTENVKEANPEL